MAKPQEPEYFRGKERVAIRSEDDSSIEGSEWFILLTLDSNVSHFTGEGGKMVCKWQ